MPNNLIKSFAKRTGKSVTDLEEMWNELSKQAEKEGKSGNDKYQFIVGVMKKNLKIEQEGETTTDNIASYIRDTLGGKEDKSFFQNLSDETGVAADQIERVWQSIKKRLGLEPLTASEQDYITGYEKLIKAIKKRS